MKKLVVTLLLYLFPVLVLAEKSSMSFAPPPSDYSVVFLGNLFGLVDGILSGTGSQIMSSMFGVFNAAVLALGGVVILYTLTVSTMNTAHEGQMLGQKWSSIWVPLRSVAGLALLIPKGSGYCLMQIFVMWIVVQGVGAADKIWDAALSYLNRGGVIVQAQIKPQDLIQGGAIGNITAGATTVLSGQVCMLGLQKILERKRQDLLDLKAKKSGPCINSPDNSFLQNFCKTPVPDFLGSVNAVSYQNDHKDQTSWSVSMPNLNTGTPYSILNGICGSITWDSPTNLSNSLAGLATNPKSGQNQTIGKPSTEWNPGGIWDINKGLAGFNPNLGLYTKGATVTLNAQEVALTQMSRAIAVQQMYMNLTLLTRTIVGNDPNLTRNSNNNKKPFNDVASQQFGIPFTQSGQVCNNYGEICTTWGPVTGGELGGGTLFSGSEFLNAVNAYNAIMMPTLNLVQHIDNAVNNSKATDFISKASADGWAMAGSYFLDLVLIQGGNSSTNSNKVDSKSGLDRSVFLFNELPKGLLLPDGGCGGQYIALCYWFQKDFSSLQNLITLIRGSAATGGALSTPSLSSNLSVVNKLNSSTVFGFVNNSMMIQLPGQPGLAPMTFANSLNIKPDLTLYTLSPQQFSCGEVKIMFFSFCLGQMLGNLFYNVIFMMIYNVLMVIIGQLIQQIVFAFLMVPLQGMMDIFKQGVATLSAPGANPIVALATMGVNYINYTGNLWLILLNMAITAVILPPMFFVIMLVIPMVVAWASIMVSIGFVTAYYIPILPYMIFTFGVIAWLIAVIEAMVAAPIVALGVTHPEGHEAFGKGEAAIMILVNVFLRPSMMIIGYIGAIALSYVGIWVLNSGFNHAVAYLQQADPNKGTAGGIAASLLSPVSTPYNADLPSGKGGYVGWASIYAYFFAILIYTSMYLVIVQKAFTLITMLPDKVLRWIGGSPESLGQETAQWGEEVKGKAEGAGKEIYPVQQQIGKQLGGYGMKGIKSAVSKATSGGSVSAEATPDPGGGEKK